LLLQALLSRQRQTATEATRPARVLQIAVLFDAERVLAFDHFRRIIGEVDHHARQPIDSIGERSSTPAAHQKLQEYERSSLRVVAAEAHAGVPAGLAGG